jgi:hypothetical protein
MYLSENMRLVLRYSFLVALLFALVFAVAKIFHLEGVTELRFINYLILFPVVYAALKKAYDLQGHKMEYFPGFTMAFLISALGQLWYSILFFIYLQIDSTFMTYLFEQFPKRIIYPELSIAFIVLTEGISIGVIVALATMQYFKRKRGRWATTNK